jgi:hypothetical protein
MAYTRSALASGLSGQVGKQLVFKRYGNKTVVTRYPDMSRVKPSPAQKDRRQLFAEAVAYARAINNDPVRKAAYLQTIPKGEKVYQFALKEYLRNYQQPV